MEPFDQLAVAGRDQAAEQQLKDDADGEARQQAGAGPAPDPTTAGRVAALVEERQQGHDHQQRFQALAEQDHRGVEDAVAGGLLVRFEARVHAVEDGLRVGQRRSTRVWASAMSFSVWR